MCLFLNTKNKYLVRMKLDHLLVLWLGIFCFVPVVTSSPTKRTSSQATLGKLSRLNEKRMAPTEEERNERRSAYVPTGNDENNEEHEARLEIKDGSETADFELRGNDYYGSQRTDEL